MTKIPSIGIVLIAAVGRNACIGKQGSLPWHLPSDLKRFKALTMGHPIIMGRKTWDSLPKKPLPGRDNIVVTKAKSTFPGAQTANSMEEAIRMATETGSGEAFVIGGAEIYELAMPFASRLEITLVHDEPADCDAFFPDIHDAVWEIENETYETSTPPSVYQTYIRRK